MEITLVVTRRRRGVSFRRWRYYCTAGRPTLMQHQEEFATLIDHLGIGKPKPAKQKSPAKPRTGEKSIRSFFEVIPK